MKWKRFPISPHVRNNFIWNDVLEFQKKSEYLPTFTGDSYKRQCAIDSRHLISLATREAIYSVLNTYREL